jgi:hypothetical protein
MKNRSGTKSNVVGHPNVAEDKSEDPFLFDFVNKAGNHHRCGDQKVGDGQRHENKVRRMSKTLNSTNGSNDNDVANNTEHDNDRIRLWTSKEEDDIARHEW